MCLERPHRKNLKVLQERERTEGFIFAVKKFKRGTYAREIYSAILYNPVKVGIWKTLSAFQRNARLLYFGGAEGKNAQRYPSGFHGWLDGSVKEHCISEQTKKLHKDAKKVLEFGHRRIVALTEIVAADSCIVVGQSQLVFPQSAWKWTDTQMRAYARKALKKGMRHD